MAWSRSCSVQHFGRLLHNEKVVFVANGAQVHLATWPTLTRSHVYETIPNLHDWTDTLLRRPILPSVLNIEDIARLCQQLEDVRDLVLISLQALGRIPKVDCPTMKKKWLEWAAPQTNVE